MSSTFVRFRGKGFEANDSTLEIWLLLLVHEIDSWGVTSNWLKRTRDEWFLQATGDFGFGVMPGLDAVVANEEQREVIVELASRVLSRLRCYGETISVAELNQIRGDESFTEPVPTILIMNLGEYFVKLLRGELEPQENDARFPNR